MSLVNFIELKITNQIIESAFWFERVTNMVIVVVFILSCLVKSYVVHFIVDSSYCAVPYHKENKEFSVCALIGITTIKSDISTKESQKTIGLC